MNRRLLVLVTLGVLWLAALVARLYALQVRDHDLYADRAERQQSRIVELAAARGTIYDARGRELAVSVEVESAAADPGQVTDPSATADALAETLGLDRAEHRKLSEDLQSNRGFVWVSRKLDPPVAEKVRALELDGVFLVTETRRYYPLRSLAAQILGYVGVDNEGLAGLEYLYEELVAGEPGRRTVVRDARAGIVLRPSLGGDAAKPGRDLHLTLDATIQNIAERALEEAVEKYHAARGMAVMMDPETGAILAMASAPNFDPNRYGEFPAETWRNLPVSDAYEPGSTFKMITLAAALEAHAVDPEKEYECEMGGITLHGVRIRDHHPFGRLSVRQILAKSSNVGAIKIGRDAGRQQFYDTILAFGFGKPTGIDLPNENAGLLRAVERWQALSPAYISFGQGISTTALQMTAAFAAIANGGWLVKPHVVAATGTPDALDPAALARIEVDRRRVPIAPSTLATVRDILETVVADGTAKAAAVPGYRAAGKTGTAQKAVHGRYAANQHVASFVGFAPLDEPRLVAMVVIDEPRPLYHGGEVAAPVWSEIVRRTLLHLGAPPDAPSDDPLWPYQRPPEARTEPPPGIQVAVRRTEPEPGTVPDLRGLDAAAAIRRAAAVGLRPILDGHGAVEDQQPPPGTPLDAADGRLELRLSLDALRAAASPAASVTLGRGRPGLEGAP